MSSDSFPFCGSRPSRRRPGSAAGTWATEQWPLWAQLGRPAPRHSSALERRSFDGLLLAAQSCFLSRRRVLANPSHPENSRHFQRGTCPPARAGPWRGPSQDGSWRFEVDRKRRRACPASRRDRRSVKQANAGPSARGPRAAPSSLHSVLPGDDLSETSPLRRVAPPLFC